MDADATIDQSAVAYVLATDAGDRRAYLAASSNSLNTAKTWELSRARLWHSEEALRAWLDQLPAWVVCKFAGWVIVEVALGEVFDLPGLAVSVERVEAARAEMVRIEAERKGRRKAPAAGPKLSLNTGEGHR